MKLKIILAILVFVGAKFSFADENHGKASPAKAQEEHHDHAEEDKKEDHKEHSHGGASEEAHEENANVGPDKGITAADEHDGIKLSPEAIKNFDLKTMILPAGASWEVPLSAILTSGEEINVYRLRNGFYKRIDFNLLSKSKSHMKMNSKELAKGDAIVINGVGFLRTAEITAFGGAPEGHSH